MEGDSSSIDKPTDPTRSTSAKEKSVKAKRADQELKKCMDMGNGKSKEKVLKSYSCAWQKDILIHGRLHLTQNWICFYSNILGWETKTNINLKDVTAISKQRTALVFPNAILVQVGDKKYGFTSFVHRDHAYKVLQLIWQNSQLHQPSNHDTLRSQLTHLFTTHRQNPPLVGRLKSSSFSSDMETLTTSSPNHSRSSSFPSTPNTSDSQPHVSHLLGPSESDLGTESDDMITPREQVDGVVLSRLQHQFVALGSSSSCRSSSEEEEGTALGHSHSSSNSSVHHHSSDLDLQHTSGGLLGSNSSVRSFPATSQPILRPALLPEAPVQSETLLGGSPNFLHHWKRTLSIRTIWQNVVTIAKPQHLIQLCTPSRLINMLIILFIVLLLLSTVSMVCQLSRVEPALHPYLGWQPWCSCAGHHSHRHQ